MNMKDADMSAYPIIGATLDGNEGLTKREHFAGLIMASLAGTNRYMGRHAAESAVQWADALLTELNKGE
jgi:hypothetical protein